MSGLVNRLKVLLINERVSLKLVQDRKDLSNISPKGIVRFWSCNKAVANVAYFPRSGYSPACPIWNVLGWVPCVQVTSHLNCITCVQVPMYPRRWANSPDHFPIRRSLPARPEPDNTFWAYRVRQVWLKKKSAVVQRWSQQFILSFLYIVMVIFSLLLMSSCIFFFRYIVKDKPNLRY